jgi:hypothetical protein
MGIAPIQRLTEIDRASLGILENECDAAASLPFAKKNKKN